MVVHYYLQSEEEVFKELNTSLNGLTTQQRIDSRNKHGSNVITIHKPVTFLELLFAQFKNYLVWLLIGIASFAFVITFYFNSDHLLDGIIVSIIILLNAFASALQDYKSEKASLTLQTFLKNEALVMKDGIRQNVDAQELVVGDIIYLEEGNKIPADCRLIRVSDFVVDESLLTGESLHVTKHTTKIHKEVALADQKNMAFMNTYVVGGSAKAIVTRVGMHTEVGKIAKSLDVPSESLFIEEVDAASKKITVVASLLIIIVMVILSFQGHDWISIFLIGSALIIGSIPEGLPAVVTFALSISSLKLAKSNVLIKRKAILETLGSVDVICSDKTGTLTQNHMQVRSLYYDNKIHDSDEKVKKNAKTYELVKLCSLLCNEAKETDKGLVGHAEDVALLNQFRKVLEPIQVLRDVYPLQHIIPFSSKNKFVKTTHKYGKKVIHFTKGAPEVIASSCKYILINGKRVKITPKHKMQISKCVEDFSHKAYRTLALGYQIGSEKENNYVFLGLIGMHDPPKDGISDVIATIYNAGIELKIITGDNELTASAIAKECGIKNIKTISWEELQNVTQAQLRDIVEKYNVFARMTPDLKYRIVEALQANGHRVAITGDGVNDVPALKKADVGIAMGTRGADIAKEAAGIILLDDNLSSIVHGIAEGRRVFSNIRKVINYLLTANLAEILVVFVTSLFGFVPFLAIQLLWVNFVTDIAPALALGIDPMNSRVLLQKPTGAKENLINKRITHLTIGIGLKKVLLMFLLFYFTLTITNNLVYAQTMTFTWLVLSHFVRITAIRAEEKMPFFNNIYLTWALVVPIVLQLLILYTPALSKIFHVMPLSIFDWIILIASFFVSRYLALKITEWIDRHTSIEF